MIFISNNLEFLRKRAGFKQAELAEKIGVKANTISNYEKGVSQPDYVTISKLMKLFAVSSDQLLYINLSENVDDISRFSTSNKTSDSLPNNILEKFLEKIDERDKKIEEKDKKIEEQSKKILEMTQELSALRHQNVLLGLDKEKKSPVDNASSSKSSSSSTLNANSANAL